MISLPPLVSGHNGGIPVQQQNFMILRYWTVPDTVAFHLLQDS